MRSVDFRDKIPRHPTRKWKKRLSADTIIIHTTASDQQNPSVVARYHITPGPQNHISSKGCPSIAYHDFIDKFGTVYHCNDYDDWTWHARIYNKRSIGVVMAFRGQDHGLPYPDQYDALLKHTTKLCLFLHILPERVIGHREVPGMYMILGNGSIRYKKECPGLAVNMNKVRDEITRRLQRRLASLSLYTGKIDGLFGPKSKAALLSFKPGRL